MEQKKLLNELTDDELLNLLSSPPMQESQVSDTFNNPVLDFFSFHDIKSGEYPVHINTLYEYYQYHQKYPESLKNFKLLALSYIKHEGNLLMLNKSNEFFYYESKVKIGNSAANVNKFIAKYNLAPGSFWTPEKYVFQLYMIANGIKQLTEAHKANLRSILLNLFENESDKNNEPLYALNKNVKEILNVKRQQKE